MPEIDKETIWDRYGIEPVINGQGNTTVLVGSSLSSIVGYFLLLIVTKKKH